MIRIRPEVFAAADDGFEARLQALKNALQTAIELEHSTIPPYLYALYAIKAGTNLEIVSLIRSIVRQEMLHMSLDCNVLNAIGGRPRIADPKFVPHYPGHLPGSVEGSLIVPLAPFSKQLVFDVFMVIEEPAHVPDYPIGASQEAVPQDGLTIGEFYGEIKKRIRDLCQEKNIFVGAPERQLTTGFAALQICGVTDEVSAMAAIDLIVEQGEGSDTSPLDPEHELAHFYKYEEIYYGRKLVRNPDWKPGAPAWAFVGHAIVFDPAGVRSIRRRRCMRRVRVCSNSITVSMRGIPICCACSTRCSTASRIGSAPPC